MELRHMPIEEYKIDFSKALKGNSNQGDMFITIKNNKTIKKH